MQNIQDPCRFLQLRIGKYIDINQCCCRKTVVRMTPNHNVQSQTPHIRNSPIFITTSGDIKFNVLQLKEISFETAMTHIYVFLVSGVQWHCLSIQRSKWQGRIGQGFFYAIHPISSTPESRRGTENLSKTEKHVCLPRRRYNQFFYEYREIAARAARKVESS